MGDILYQELWGASGPQYGPWFGGMVLSTLCVDQRFPGHESQLRRLALACMGLLVLK